MAKFFDFSVDERLEALAQAADHKRIFFAEKSPDGASVDYYAAVSGGLCLVPNDEALAKLAADYQHMVDDGLFLDQVESFDTLLRQCQAIQRKTNAVGTNGDLEGQPPA